MIDPKFNELAVEAEGDFADPYGNSVPVEENAETTRSPRQGLSIRDTIAGDSLLSTGARGLDTSGVEAGAGAGAGMTFVTPGGSAESPAPEIEGGARGSGSTVRADGPAIQDAATLKIDSPAVPNASGDVAARAYERWCERGCPHGSPEEDWHAAEEELRIRQLYKTTSA